MATKIIITNKIVVKPGHKNIIFPDDFNENLPAGIFYNGIETITFGKSFNKKFLRMCSQKL
jgi:hypothetical protein